MTLHVSWALVSGGAVYSAGHLHTSTRTRSTPSLPRPIAPVLPGSEGFSLIAGLPSMNLALAALG